MGVVVMALCRRVGFGRIQDLSRSAPTERGGYNSDMKRKRAAVKSVYGLADLQHWKEADPPVRLGVFGDPVEHSLSPQIQNAAIKHSKIDMQYAQFHILPDELRRALQRARRSRLNSR